MKQILINKVPEPLHARVKASANKNKRTIAMECMQALEEQYPEPKPKKPRP